jgi:tetratricopeptide (TPR) repeat protein
MIARAAIFLLVLLPALAVGQDHFVEAYKRYQSGDVAGAREYADKAVASPSHARDADAWLLHGFIYKDLYKAAPDHSEGGQRRITALESLFKSITLDTAGTVRQNATQAYEYMLRTYYNDAAKALSEMDPGKAEQSFLAYKEAMLRLDPEASMREREIEFHNALGTVHTKRFNQDRTDLGPFDRAVAAFEHVLELDPNNYGANYNLATLHYNRGVFKIRMIDAEYGIPEIQRIQEVSREYFQRALPYMLKAHDMNPTRRETLLGLEGIYYSLQDQENSDRFRMLFEELSPQDMDK